MSNIEDRIILMNLLSRNGILMDVLHSEFDEQPGTILENNLISSDQSNLSDKIMNHVTLKIDVSHTDHGHLIGRYGCNIKAVVMKTLCHIHFPDSNKNNLSNKSNQVSISGSLRNVEKARRIIRDLLPITFTFEIPYLINENLSTNQISPLIQQIQMYLR
ncbi:unnamed protein product [Heterobilharzia americana]|nr:unnamed protein product [Heterobilharzia americana]